MNRRDVLAMLAAFGIACLPVRAAEPTAFQDETWTDAGRLRWRLLGDEAARLRLLAPVGLAAGDLWEQR